MTLLRRSFGLACLGLSIPLVACGNVKTAVVIADIKIAFAALSAQLPGLARANPSLAAKITPYINDGNALAKNLAAASPTMITDVTTIEGFLNAILRTAADGQQLPPPYDKVIAALAVMAPIVESYANSLLPPDSPKKVAARAPFPHPGIENADQARATFAAYAQ